jgi:hypothetical protein
MSNFGPRVLGKNVHAEQEATRKVNQARGFTLGKRVTGVVKAKAAKAPVEEPSTAPEPFENADVAGTIAPTDPDQVVEIKAVDVEPASEIAPMSVKQIEQALSENTSIALFDQILALEFERPEGTPRIGALRALLAVEERRDEPRAAIMVEISQALKRD